MHGLPERGPIDDARLKIIADGGVLIAGDTIAHVGNFEQLRRDAAIKNLSIEEVQNPSVLLPGFIDAHTHICFAGNRARDYALRVAGTPYLEIAKQGGGILDTVSKTRLASEDALTDLLISQLDRHLSDGVTTCEVKSGYGLSLNDELKMLNAIRRAAQLHPASVIATCLAAHVRPKEFSDNASYLKMIVADLLPQVKKESLAERVDIFVEDGAFTPEEAISYLKAAKDLGFKSTVHADQFHCGGSRVAAQTGAISADHLEASGDNELAQLKSAGVIATALPGASLGLGMSFAPARKILDTGLSLVIASDWNPGSAPMGDLLLQAAVLGANQKLSFAETLAAITCRASHALSLKDRGSLTTGNRADFIAFPTTDYRDILYHQGRLKPSQVWTCGLLRKNK